MNRLIAKIDAIGSAENRYRGGRPRRPTVRTMENGDMERPSRTCLQTRIRDVDHLKQEEWNHFD